MAMRMTVLAGYALSAAVPCGAQASYCFTKELPDAMWTASFGKPMHYEVLRQDSRVVLLAEGEVKAGEGDRLAAAIDQAGSIDEVWFNSPGGDANEGPKMGRALRQRGAFVRLTAGRACISACSYAFLGGVVRIVDPGGYYGVHMFHSAGLAHDLAAQTIVFNRKAAALMKSGADPAKVTEALQDVIARELRGFEQEAAKTAAIRARYLVEMSLSLDFMTDAFGTGSSEVCYLNPAGLARYNVANAR